MVVMFSTGSTACAQCDIAYLQKCEQYIDALHHQGTGVGVLEALQGGQLVVLGLQVQRYRGTNVKRYKCTEV